MQLESDIGITRFCSISVEAKEEMKRIFIVTVSFLIVSGCESPASQTIPHAIHESQTVDRLEIIDSIGVEFGDSNYVSAQ